jgi:hypothetical protein
MVAPTSSPLNPSSLATFGLLSKTTIVDTSGATAPVAGQILTATDASNATWQYTGVGYTTGTGGTVTQATSKATAFTLSKICGTITTPADALANATTASSTWTNTTIAATDVIVISHISGGTIGAYVVSASAGAGTATLNIRNVHTASLSEALILRFAVIKAVIT